MNTPNYYHYDHVSGEYVGSSPADPDPMNDGGYLNPPRFATFVAPPDAEPGKARCWMDSSWVQVLDIRGTLAWRRADGQPVVFDALGELPEVLTPLEPTDLDMTWDGQRWAVDAAKRLARQTTDAMAMRTQLLSEASETTAGMSDAYLAGLLTAEEEAKYRAFAAYKLALVKLPQQSGWPAAPAWPAKPE
ncbi:tail fiber assembly protein [Cupriavidus basilensis]|uniref:tail fiber assembly protein n=1 Tax=Cupriavidus basilensis TaxID=68895 RepID=UPI0039F660CB